MYESGEHAARLLLDLIHDKAKPVIAWAQPPLLTHTLRSSTADGAMKRAVDAARAAEAEDGVLAVSVLSGFSLADIAAPCISVVVVADGERAKAQSVADRIARQIWNERDAFVYRSVPLTQSISEGAALARETDKPVLLLDHGDNCMSGGTCDTTDAFEEALKQGLDGIVVGPLCDPEAVAQLFAAGEGATVTIGVGNKLASVASRAKPPLEVTGIVRALTDGEYIISGPTYTGQRCVHGPRGRDRDRRGAHPCNGTHARAVGPGRVRECRHRSTRRALSDSQVAHVLPPRLRADIGWPRRMR